jgi:recombination protein RecT
MGSEKAASQVPVTQETKKTWVDLFKENRQAFQEALPRVGITPDQMIRIVSTCMRMNPDLKKCTGPSLISCMMQACEVGLSLSNTLGHAYLVPYNNNKKGVKEATFMIGYKGLVALARRSGEIKAIRAKVVYDKEPFELPTQLGDQIVHQSLPPSQRGEKYGVYAEAALKDGGYQWVFLWPEEVLSYRKRSKASSSGPWVTDEEEMWMKTALRRLCKLLPMAVEDARAIADDEYRDMGLTASDLDMEDSGLAEGEKETLEGSVKTVETTATEVTGEEGAKAPEPNGKSKKDTGGQ